MTMMKRGETHCKTMILGWPRMLWPSMDEYITFHDTQRNYFLGLTPRP
jgi:hypothetical protein